MVATDKMASEINGIGVLLSSDSIKTLSKKISNIFHNTSAKDTLCTNSARQNVLQDHRSCLRGTGMMQSDFVVVRKLPE